LHPHDRPPTFRPTRLRRSLRASIAEGIFAELVNATAGPTILVGWALHLGASPVEVGVVGALPQLSQVVQLPAAWASALLGRRRVAIAAVAASRQAILPLALIPLLRLSPAAARSLLLAVAGMSAALATVGNNAWTAWMGELVPARIRGRWFGRRTAACVLAGTAGALGAARLLDGAGRSGRTGAALALLTVFASAFGAATAFLMARQHDAPGPAPARPAPGLALRPLCDPAARRLLSYQIAWNASVGLAGGYFAFHLLSNLRVGYTVVALHAGAAALARMVTAPLWGRAVDRFGARPVLAACSFGAASLPLLWLASAPDRLWPIAIDAVVGGVAWSGHNLASFAAPLAVAPRRERPFYLATFSTASGLSYALAVAAAGPLAGSPPPGSVPHGLGLVFALSAAGRLAAAFLALRVEERGAGSLGDLRSAAAAVLAGVVTRARDGAHASVGPALRAIHARGDDREPSLRTRTARAARPESRSPSAATPPCRSGERPRACRRA
jgi:MFS family permease